MQLDKGTYFGDTVKSIVLESAVLTLTEYVPGATLPNHQHSSSYLSALIKGGYREVTKDICADITPGCIIYRPPQYEHANEFPALNSLCFNVELRSHLDSVAPLPNDKPLIGASQFCLQKLLVGFLNNWGKDELSCLVYESFLKINPVHKKRPQVSWISKIIDLIETEYGTEITISYLAEAINVHPVYLARKFKEQQGVTIGEYLRSVRLRRAFEEIAYTDNKLVTVAVSNGFYDQSHMIRSIKDELKLSPRHLRSFFTG